VSTEIKPQLSKLSACSLYVPLFSVPSCIAGRLNLTYAEKVCTHTHTHTFNSPLSRTTQVSRYQTGKTNLDFTEARDSEWQWHQLGHMQIWTSLQTDNHASTSILFFYRPDTLPATQPTASKHWRQQAETQQCRKGAWAKNGLKPQLYNMLLITFMPRLVVTLK